MLFPESKADRRHRLLEAKYDRWFAQPQPIRFYLWVLWLHLKLFFRVAYVIRRLFRRRLTFKTFVMPAIRAPLDYSYVLDSLVSVQPMTKPLITEGTMFWKGSVSGYEIDKPKPGTRKASGWLWGIVIWEQV